MPPVSQQLKPAPHSQQCCQFVRRDLDAAHKMTARVLVGLQTVVRTWMGAAAALEADLQPMVSSGLIHKSSGPELQSGGTYGLSGRWRKDRTSSDDMGAACDAVCLPWLLRKALRILNVLEVEDSDEHFRTKVKAGGLMDVVECYPWDGSERSFGRRDKRRQAQTGHVSREEGKPSINVRWSDPYGGQCTDQFALSEDGLTLTQSTTMTMNETERSCHYRTVYRRI